MINRTKFLVDTEVQALYGPCTLDTRDGTMIILALETGGRASEILSVTRECLFKDTNTVLFKSLKQGNDREIPVSPQLFEALLKYIPFGISYPRLDQVWRKLRPCNKKFHALRHTFALNLYKRTRDIRLVQVALGHKSLSNTMIYVEYIYSTEELRRIIPVQPSI